MQTEETNIDLDRPFFRTGTNPQQVKELVIEGYDYLCEIGNVIILKR